MAQHVVPVSRYYFLFLGLLFLTFATVELAFRQYGYLNLWLALALATFKATLVILIFMHVLYQPKLMRVFAFAGFLWLVILLAFTFSDYLTRPWLGFVSS